MRTRIPDYFIFPLRRIPWHIFLFVFVVFYFSTPYNLTWPREHSVLQMMDSGTASEIIKKGSIGRRIALLSLVGVSLIGLLRRGLHGLRPIGLMGYLIIFYVSWATLSIFWTDDPFLTIRRLMVFWILAISAFSMAARLSLKDIMAITFLFSTATLLVSIGAELVLGFFHPLHSGYRFSGVMHPVAQGWNCGLLAISAVSLSSYTQGGYRYSLRAVFLIAIIFLIFTRSRMPLASVIMALGLYWLLSASVSKILASVCGLIIFLCIVYFMAADQLIKHADVFVHLGRGDEALESVTTLTGRTLLWRECIRYVSDSLLWGRGYEVFLSPTVLAKVSSQINWIPANSHSGFIQNLLGLGIIGLTVFTGILICSFQRAFFLFRISKNYLFIIIVLTWLCTNLLPESAIITEPIFPTFLTMVILSKLGFVLPDKHQIPDSAKS